MRIAVVTSSYPRYLGDGAGTFVYSLCAALVRAGHQVRVFACDDPKVNDSWQTEVPVSRVRYIRPRRWAVLGHAGALETDVRLKGLAYLLVLPYVLASALHLYYYIRHNGCDVIFAQWIVPGGSIGAIVGRLTGIPLVIAAHGSDVYLVTRNPLAGMAGRAALRRARAVITCSRDFATRVIALGAPKAATIPIPYGVEHIRYSADDSARSLLGRTLGIEPGAPILLAMGRLVYKKGFSYLLSAMPAILAERSDAVLVIAGSGPLERELRDETRTLNLDSHVLFIGHVPWQETQRYMAGATIVIVPSIIDQAGNVDGLPNVLLEAMACGCAIVASNIAGIPDVIADGFNGILVPEKDPGGLSDAIVGLLNSPGRGARLGSRARETAVTALSWTSIATRVERVLARSIEDTPSEA